MFFIDIAVPRDVDPEMNRVDGVFLYDIDDLQSVATSNMADRSREATSAERIIAEEVARFARRASALDVVPTLVGLQASVESMRQAEMRRAQVRLQGLTAEQQAAVETLTRGLANKFLHLPLQALRDAAQQGDAARLDMLRETFRLESIADKPEPTLAIVETSDPAPHRAPQTETDTALADRDLEAPAAALPGGKQA
jgi:glutamyl-tRNA reductase